MTPTVARRYVPPQHGAWAMLLVPFVVGASASGFAWLHLPLLAAWVLGYLAWYFVLQTIKARQARYTRQIAVYAAPAGLSAALVLGVRPDLLAYAPAFAPLLLVNAWYAWRHNERALANDVAAVLEACAMLFVAFAAGAEGGAGVDLASLAEPARLALPVFLYFTGTALYVKTMLRERGKPAYRRWSVVYHAAALPVAALAAWPFAIPFLLYLGRAALLPSQRRTALQVGVLEVGNATLLTGFLLGLAWALP